MKSLPWKEWREQRTFFLIAVGFIILSRMTILLAAKRIPFVEDYLIYIGLFILPGFFSLFLGAVPFTNEFLHNTKTFLISRPSSSARIFWTKLLFNLGLLLVLIGLTALLYLTGIKGITGYQVLTLFLTATIIYFAACFSSLLLKNTLTAVMCTPFILLLAGIILAPLIVVLVLISNTFSLFIFLAFSFVMATFLTLEFFTWQKAIVKDIGPAKIILKVLLIIIVVSFGSHIVANFTVGWNLRKTMEQAKSQGIKLTPEEVIPPPVPDKDNAALLYQEAFALADSLKKKYKTEWEYMPYENQKKLEELTAGQKRTIGKIMQDPDFIKLYYLLERSSTLPACRFNRNYNNPVAMILPELASIRRLARLCAARVYIIAEEKHYREALNMAETGLRLGDSLASDFLIISQLVRIAMDQIAAKSIVQFLNSPNVNLSSADYGKIIFIIDKKNRYLGTALEGELAIFGHHIFEKGYMWQIYYSQTGTPQKLSLITRLNIGITQTIMNPLTKTDLVFYIRLLSPMIGYSRQPYFLVKNKIAAWNKLMDYTTPDKQNANYRFKTMKRVMSTMTLPALGRTLEQQAKYNAGMDALKLVLALKIYKNQHGTYPVALSSLAPAIISELPKDPFTGNDFLYRKKDTGFIIYSVGPNEQDNNGVYDSKNKNKQGPDYVAFQDDITYELEN